MNVITLTGNAVKDIEISYNQSGTAFAKGTIAVQRNYKNQAGEYESDFINFTGIGKSGELMANYIKKGDRFGITGALRINSSEKDGKRSYFTEVVVNGFDFPSKRSEGGGNTNTQQGDPFANNGGSIDISDDTLPF